MHSWPMIPPADRFDITYEQLCQDPDATVTKILHRLGLPDAACNCGQSVAPRGARVVEPVATRRDLITRKLHEYGSTVGYDLRALADKL